MGLMNTQRRLTQRESCNMQQVEVTERTSKQNFISVEFSREIKRLGPVPLAEQKTFYSLKKHDQTVSLCRDPFCIVVRHLK